MTRRYPAKLPALAALLTVLGSTSSSAAERACAAPSVEADTGLRARFPDLLPRVRSELTSLDDLDTCAHIELSLRQGAICVDVTLPDGRTASRTAAVREDVLPTLQALLLVPEPRGPSPATGSLLEAAPRAAPQARPRALARRTRRALTARAERDPESPLPSLEPRALGVELSLLSGARIGDGQTSFGLGALSFLELDGWLLGGEARADRYQSLSGDSQEAALELAVLLGRRIQFSGVALDVSGGLAVAKKGIAVSDTEVVRVEASPGQTTTPPEPLPEPGSEPVPRLLFASRLGFSPRSVLRTFIGLDGEVGPGLAEQGADRGATGLPRWTVGLSLGATVGTQ